MLKNFQIFLWRMTRAKKVLLRVIAATLIIGTGLLLYTAVSSPLWLTGGGSSGVGGGGAADAEGAGRRPFQWRNLQDSGKNGVVSGWFGGNENNNRDDGAPGDADGDGAEDSKSCRNTVQGESLVTDERGFTCRREYLKESGCCSTAANATSTSRYMCSGCLAESLCCTTYEHCVACCLRPSEVSYLRELVSNAKSLLFSLVEDPFELCLAKCRTSSGSVMHENIYRSSKFKYCVRQTTPSDSELAAVQQLQRERA